ncbi:MAG: DNA cytosine methyltransferase [Promethearchaeota archaeon]
MSKLRFCDLFCGAGGFSLGFVEKGYEILGAIDHDPSACQSYRFNISKKVMEADITDVHPFDFLDFLGSGRPDFVIVSPPCEGFTDANPSRLKDRYERLYNPPGSLMVTAIDWICDLDPKLGFIIENVPAIITSPIKKLIEDELRRIGYDDVYFNLIRAEILGSASKRPRIFISNFKIDQDDLKNYTDSTTNRQWRSVWDVLQDLPDPTDIHGFYNHVYIPLSEKKQKAIQSLRFGDNLISYRSATGYALIPLKQHRFLWEKARSFIHSKTGS